MCICNMYIYYLFSYLTRSHSLVLFFFRLLILLHIDVNYLILEIKLKRLIIFKF